MAAIKGLLVGRPDSPAHPKRVEVEVNMHESPGTRRRVVLTMTRGDEAARKPDGFLKFKNLGGPAVLSQPARRALALEQDPWAVYRLGGSPERAATGR